MIQMRRFSSVFPTKLAALMLVSTMIVSCGSNGSDDPESPGSSSSSSVSSSSSMSSSSETSSVSSSETSSISSSASSMSSSSVAASDPVISVSSDYEMPYSAEGDLVKQVVLDVSIESGYAHISVLSGDNRLVDNMNIPNAGAHQLTALVEFESAGDKTLTLTVRGEPVTLQGIEFRDPVEESIPLFADITSDIGMETEKTLKYGGPTVADLNNDGHYDMVLNNHNVIPAQVYWNNGDSTVTEQAEPLFSWPPDLHGTAAGDYDNDGDLDLLMTKGGGNGTNPAPPFLMRNDEGTFTRVEDVAGITKGARGRAARWIDMDLDGDLDLALINAAGINGDSGEQHIFYKNIGDGSFEPVRIPGIENAQAERTMVLDFNRDGIDDILLFSPTSLWQGNGDFTFTNVTTTWLPESARNVHQVHAAANTDIDNDGDYDIYLARGKPYYQMANKSLDFDPQAQQLDFKDEGNAGTTELSFTAPGSVELNELDLTYRGYDGDFPVFLGSAKTPEILDFESVLEISRSDADGWPEERAENGIYIGHTGDGEWRVESVRNQNVYWKVDFTLKGVSSVDTSWEPNNRNVQDLLLINEGDHFVEAGEAWDIPKGGNHWGVTYGDFNNDGFSDFYVYRFGFMKQPVADYLLLNNGGSGFSTTTMHNAFDPNDGGHSDMGQAFDFDLDGGVDMLNGSDEYGKWYLYKNRKVDTGNYVLIQVGYSPLAGIDPISAEVVVETPSNTYVKRVASAGEVFSQSVLNTVHFGLGDAETITSVSVRWRNGESISSDEVTVNALFKTDDAELPAPNSITLTPDPLTVREGTSEQLNVELDPPNADPSMTWTSSDDAVASVDGSGLVTGHQAGASATITATSDADGTTAEAMVDVTEYFGIPVEGVSVTPGAATVFVGTTDTLTAEVSPEDADDPSVEWTASDESVATVDANGVVTGVASGQASVTATTVDGGFSDSATIDVEEYQDPSVAYDDESYYKNTTFYTNENLSVSADYHAGSGNTVIDSSYGGFRFMLRHLNGSWGVEQDITTVYSDAIGTTSGTATVSISLEGLTPTSELPEGHFYFLFVQFSSSDGTKPEKGVWPIKIENAP